MVVGTKPRVRVHMKPGQGETLDGLLLSKFGKHYRLIDVEVVGGDHTPLDGEVYVPRANVLAVQVLYR